LARIFFYIIGGTGTPHPHFKKSYSNISPHSFLALALASWLLPYVF
jgi:hypothetical protein